ncbi:5522_t:CDS:2 [Dentiscutata erythropus]|uniref:5522_t:CDS:1 n=1 Tax=Dentiscutata erythropus TaxID=1348616 RepID=A0A9N9CYH3_9GLOM|nr:5522_t:CDS:2 [Dentiscutata erythropus]
MSSYIYTGIDPMDNCDKCDGEDSLDILKAADELELYSLIQRFDERIMEYFYGSSNL